MIFGYGSKNVYENSDVESMFKKEGFEVQITSETANFPIIKFPKFITNRHKLLISAKSIVYGLTTKEELQNGIGILFKLEGINPIKWYFKKMIGRK